MKRATNSIRNQRLSTTKQRKQQHLLDVKVRSYKFKQQRNRKIVTGLCKVVILASMIGGIYYGGRECMNRFFWRNPDYSLTNIEINDDGTLSREQILAASGIREGENIFLVNLSRARENLGQLPQVEHVELERMLPGKVAITIAERKPIAWLTARGSEDPTISEDSFLIDGKGTLIKSKKQLPEYFHLPVICGFATDNLEAGQILIAPEIKAALKLIELDADNTRFQIRGIDLSKGYCMVVTNQSHMEITFGLERLDGQLQHLGLLLDYVDGRNKILQTANLMVERNVPVTFVQPSDDHAGEAAPAEPPPAEKPKEKTPLPVKKAEPPRPKIKTMPTVTPLPVRKALPVQHAYGNG